MTLAQLRATLDQSSPPTNLPSLLTALWWEAKGNWNQAHEIAQSENGSDAAWIHAYLYRKEGDTGNAGYWYRQARQGDLHVAARKRVGTDRLRSAGQINVRATMTFAYLKSGKRKGKTRKNCRFDPSNLLA